MKSILHLLAFGWLLAATPHVFSQSTAAPVDFDKARQLFGKRQKGETLTPDETAYIKRAKAAHDGQAKQLLEFFATNPLSKGWFTGM